MQQLFAGCFNFPSNFRKLDNDFDVVGSSLQSLFEKLRLFKASDQATQPLAVRASQIFTRFVPVTLGRIHAATNTLFFSTTAAAVIFDDLHFIGTR
jgi:hypothetical protein